jgi:hypothetical protein
VPSAHVAYWFMKNDETDETTTVINYTEKLSRAFGAHVVPRKRTDAGTAEKIIEHMEKLGIKGRLIVKCDQEQAIQQWRMGSRHSGRTRLWWKLRKSTFPKATG